MQSGPRGVYFQADERVMYQSLLWSRLASRILLPLNDFDVYSDLDLYLGVQAIDWSEIFQSMIPLLFILRGLTKKFAIANTAH